MELSHLDRPMWWQHHHSNMAFHSAHHDIESTVVKVGPEVGPEVEHSPCVASVVEHGLCCVGEHSLCSVVEHSPCFVVENRQCSVVD